MEELITGRQAAKKGEIWHCNCVVKADCVTGWLAGRDALPRGPCTFSRRKEALLGGARVQ